MKKKKKKKIDLCEPIGVCTDVEYRGELLNEESLSSVTTKKDTR